MPGKLSFFKAKNGGRSMTKGIMNNADSILAIEPHGLVKSKK
jgi:hypothetical protein